MKRRRHRRRSLITALAPAGRTRTGERCIEEQIYVTWLTNVITHGGPVGLQPIPETVMIIRPPRSEHVGDQSPKERERETGRRQTDTQTTVNQSDIDRDRQK